MFLVCFDLILYGTPSLDLIICFSMLRKFSTKVISLKNFLILPFLFFWLCRKRLLDSPRRFWMSSFFQFYFVLLLPDVSIILSPSSYSDILPLTLLECFNFSGSVACLYTSSIFPGLCYLPFLPFCFQGDQKPWKQNGEKARIN